MTLVNLMNAKNRTTDPWVNNLFDSLFQESLPQNAIRMTAPAINITEDKNGFEIEVAAPGVQKEDLKINLDKDKLTLSFEQSPKTEERKYSQRGFGINSFSRSFHLPESINKDEIEANYESGVLRIRLNKKEENVIEPRSIAVK